MVQFQVMRFADPSASVSGLATNPCGTGRGSDRGPNRAAARAAVGRGRVSREAGTDVGVVLAPGLALLGEAAARDPCRHGGCGSGGGGEQLSSLPRKGLFWFGCGWGDLGVLDDEPPLHFPFYYAKKIHPIIFFILFII